MISPRPRQLAGAGRRGPLDTVGVVSSGSDIRYILPHHPTETDRLDVQHYALLEAMGANSMAPVERPDRILDVGSGTGQWAFDLAAEHPRALVVGFDIVPGKARGPANYRFVRGNLLHGLPFRGGGFDFVHQRLMATSAIPAADWPEAVAELVRVTRPGGWVELVEVKVEVHPAGPATLRLFELLRQAGRATGLDMEGIVRSLGEHLRAAGLEAVEQREVPFAVGEWGGRVGSLNASNLRALFMRLFDVLEERAGASGGELRDLLHTMRVEWEEHHSGGNYVFAFGRRPAGVANSTG